MMRALLLLSFCLLSLALQAQDLIPQPRIFEKRTGEFVLNYNGRLLCTSDDSIFSDMMSFQSTYLFGSGCPVRKWDSTSKFISYKIDSSLVLEGYVLDVTPNRIEISGGSRAGLFYGMQSLIQLFDASIYKKEGMTENFRVPCVYIEDEPTFPWRGMLLDCGRHFMQKEFVKRYIDLLAYHKMNKLHWHLTEDQGWRIEIKKYPKLTEVGAWREDVHDEAEGKLYGGFYSQEDIREIVAYAQSRHVAIIPEIEMPGHSLAALASYPELGCTGGPYKVETEWGVFKDVYCVGNPKTFDFLKDVLDEVIELFPSKYIHIGGDEAPTYQWEHCNKCKALMKIEGMYSAHELQPYLLKKINAYLQSKGKQMIGWDEIADGELPEGDIIQSWRGMKGAEKALAQNHQTIVSPTSHAYFDYGLKSIDLKKVYSFDPIPKGTVPTKKKLVLGGECNMWSERAPQHLVDSKVFPRILAMSEVLWSYPKERNYDEFYDRVQGHYARLDAMGVKYGDESVGVKAAMISSANGSQLSLIPGVKGLEIRYSIGTHDQEYLGPISLNESTFLMAYALKNGKSYGDPLAINFNSHKAINAHYEYSSNASSYYRGTGEFALSDGWRGGGDFKDGMWQGFSGKDLELVYNFSEKPRDIQEVVASVFQYTNSWIFAPKSMTVYVSEDGNAYELIKKVGPSVSPEDRGKIQAGLFANLNLKQVKFLKVFIENQGIVPTWHEAAGSEAWMFLDEVLIR